MHAPVRTRLLVAGLGLALATTACGSISENLTERAVEGVAEAAAGQGVDIDIDDEGGRLRVETSDGAMDFGSGDLPDAFPASMPLPVGHTVQGSFSSRDESGDAMVVSVSVEGADWQAVADDLTSALADAGWEVEETTRFTSGEGGSVALAVGDGAVEGTVLVTGGGEDVAVQYQLSPADDA